MTPNIVLFDIDNTLANMDHRLHWLDNNMSKADWAAFEQEAAYDQPIAPTIVTAQAYNVAGKQIWCWTGRTERIRALTEVWLLRNQVPYSQLLMKDPDDETPAELVKLNWLRHTIPEDRVICAFDDDPGVVKVLREQGHILVMRVVRPK